MSIKHVLFIDDNHADNFLHRIKLEDAGFEGVIEEAQTGEDALELLAQRQSGPNVIFLDINMPGMDGWEFLDHFQKLAFSSSTLVVMLTNSEDPYDLNQASQNHQIDLFMVKPLDATKWQRVQRAHTARFG